MYSDLSFESFLRLMAFASIINAFLFYYLMKYRNYLSKILLLFYFICLCFLIFKWSLKLELGSYDSSLYQSLSSQIAVNLKSDFFGNLADICVGYSAYTLPLGFLYYLFGTSEPVGQLFSVLMGLGVILNLHRLALICFNRRVANLSALLVALYPYGWVLSTTLNRDIFIAFLITLLFRILAEIQNSYGNATSKLKYVLALGCIMYITFLRPPLILLCGLSFFIYFLIQKKILAKSHNIFNPIKIFFLFLAISIIALGTFLHKDQLSAFRLAGHAIHFTDIDNLNHRLDSSEQAGSAYLKGVRYSSLKDILWVMPLATLYFMFSPFPWQVHSLKQALGMIDSLWLLLITYFFLKGIKVLYRFRKKFGLALLTFLIVGFCSSSLLQKNVGAAMRHRTMFFYVMFPIAVHGFLSSRKKTAPSPVSSPIIHCDYGKGRYLCLDQPKFN